MNINKFVYKNKAIVGLCLGSTLIWAINLSGQFLMAHIFGQPQAEKRPRSQVLTSQSNAPTAELLPSTWLVVPNVI